MKAFAESVRPFGSTVDVPKKSQHCENGVKKIEANYTWTEEMVSDWCIDRDLNVFLDKIFAKTNVWFERKMQTKVDDEDSV